MAKVTDIQDKNGATREIQDKDLANRTSQSSIASSDYVLLEDTNGAYHKIAKASFTEAVRGALGSVINSVAKGTDIAKVPVLDSNNDLGMGTLSNLASVLGAALLQQTPTAINANSLVTEQRMLIFTMTIQHSQNLPSDAVYGWLIVEKMGDTIIQYYRGLDDLTYKKIRRSENNGVTWGSWVND